MVYEPPSQHSRLVALEIRSDHTSKIIDSHTSGIKDLGTKVDRLSETLAKLEHTIPFFTNELRDLVSEFKQFKTYYLSAQYEDLKHRQKEVVEEAKVDTESKFKVKLIWVGLGIIFVACVTAVIKGFQWRFGL